MKPITIKGNGGAGGATGLASSSRRARVRAIRGVIRRQAAARAGRSPRGRP